MPAALLLVAQHSGAAELQALLARAAPRCGRVYVTTTAGGHAAAAAFGAARTCKKCALLQWCCQSPTLAPNSRALPAAHSALAGAGSRVDSDLLVWLGRLYDAAGRVDARLDVAPLLACAGWTPGARLRARVCACVHCCGHRSASACTCSCR